MDISNKKNLTFSVFLSEYNKRNYSNDYFAWQTFVTPLFYKRLSADSQTKTDKSQCRTLPIKMLNVHHAKKKSFLAVIFIHLTRWLD